MLLTTVAAGMLLGSLASFALLTRGRRLDRRRVAAIERQVTPWLAALLLALAVGTLPPGYSLWQGAPVISVAAYVALCAGNMARHTTISRWRAALYGAAAVLLLALLGDGGNGHA